MKTTKEKEHLFIVAVKTTGTRRFAELAILTSFAKRFPDYCEFTIKRGNPAKKGQTK